MGVSKGAIQLEQAICSVLRSNPGVRFHTREHPPNSNEIRRVSGALATSPERTIVDSLEAGTQPE